MSYCPHCRRIVNHKSKCKKYTQEVQDKYEKDTKQRKETEDRLHLNIKKVQEEYPDVWEYLDSKIEDLRQNLRHKKRRHREPHSCDFDSSE
jgi:hypothetical protein